MSGKAGSACLDQVTKSVRLHVIVGSRNPEWFNVVAVPSIWQCLFMNVVVGIDPRVLKFPFLCLHCVKGLCQILLLKGFPSTFLPLENLQELDSWKAVAGATLGLPAAIILPSSGIILTIYVDFSDKGYSIRLCPWHRQTKTH